MSLNKLNFLVEANEPSSIIFDSIDKALDYLKENKKAVYLIVWDNGKLVDQCKIEVHPELTPTLRAKVKKELFDKYQGKKGVFYTNYPSSMLSKMTRLVVANDSYIKFIAG